MIERVEGSTVRVRRMCGAGQVDISGNMWREELQDTSQDHSTGVERGREPRPAPACGSEVVNVDIRGCSGAES